LVVDQQVDLSPGLLASRFRRRGGAAAVDINPDDAGEQLR
jgi:hypothetical protein